MEHTNKHRAQWAWYFNPDFKSAAYVNESSNKIPVSAFFRTHSLHYAGAVIEGIRRHNAHQNAKNMLGMGKDGYVIFRLKDHIQRLFYSASLYGMTNIPFTPDEVTEACEMVAKLNEDAHYLRPVIYRGMGLGIKAPTYNNDHQIIGGMVISAPWGKYLTTGTYNDGVSVGIARTRKSTSQVFPVFAKGSANYIASTLVKEQAIQEGLAELLIRHPDGAHISEATGMNFFIVENGNTLVTPNESSSRLFGITMRTIMQLAIDNGLKVEERNITIAEAIGAKECFLCGTAAAITPITMMEYSPVGDGFAGKTTKFLADLYSKVVTGEIPKYHHWCHFVTKNLLPRKK